MLLVTRPRLATKGDELGVSPPPSSSLGGEFKNIIRRSTSSHSLSSLFPSPVCARSQAPIPTHSEPPSATRGHRTLRPVARRRVHFLEGARIAATTYFLVRAVEDDAPTIQLNTGDVDVRAVVLRVFGRGTDAFLDRAVEADVPSNEFNAQGFGATCLGVFRNGRLERLGSPPGTEYFTIGQRRRLERHRRRHATISRVETSPPQTIPGNVGRPPRLMELEVEQSNWIGIDPEPGETFQAEVQVRYHVGPLGDVIVASRAQCASVASPTVTLHNDALSGDRLVPADWIASAERIAVPDDAGVILISSTSGVVPWGRRRQPFRSYVRVRVRLVETPERAKASAREILRRLRSKPRRACGGSDRVG